MKQLRNLITSAIGYDEKRGDKIELVNMRFTQDATGEGEASFFERFKLEMQSIIQTLIMFDGTLSSWWTRIVIGVLLFVFCLLQRVFESKRGR